MKVTANTPVLRWVSQGASAYLVNILCDVGAFRGEYGRTQGEQSIWELIFLFLQFAELRAAVWEDWSQSVW